MASVAQPFNFETLRVIGMVGFGFSIGIASFANCWGNPFPGTDHNLYGLASLSLGSILGPIEQKYFISMAVIVFHTLGIFMFSSYWGAPSRPFIIMVTIFLCGISFSTILPGTFLAHRTPAEAAPFIWREFREGLR